MPKYDFACDDCGAIFEQDRRVDERDAPISCPVCDSPSRRKVSSPKLLFKGDPAENRPYWHNHDGYSHSHAPRRGRHRIPDDDH
ncbi:MAG: zinc ribbon domain-containing protein [Chloroflexia bacterium]|nr:zinc ribbon domain-containing protein [Chloroflexia bacterium]